MIGVCDDGGSTGILRDELGVLPPGDARQCLVALSEAPETRELFSYRFTDGSFEGHSLGNIILSALELRHGNFESAVAVASRVLRVRGEVLPVVLGDHKLVMTDGTKTIKGQYMVQGHQCCTKEVSVRLEPTPTLNPKAAEAIKKADIVVIAPGGFYYSILPILSVPGVQQALKLTQAKVVFFTNLINQAQSTHGWHVVDYVEAAEQYIGKGTIDTVVYSTAPIPRTLLTKYVQSGDFPVSVAKERFSSRKDIQWLGEKLLSNKLPVHVAKSQKIPVRRTYIRHNAKKVADIVATLHKKKRK